MLYAVKIGPFESPDGPFNGYLAIREDGSLAGSAEGGDDAQALKELAMKALPGESMFCEGDMVEAAFAAGFRTGPVPAWAAEQRASFALWLSLAPSIAPADPHALALLGRGAASFLRAEPWRTWAPHDAIEVTVEGGLRARYEASIIGPPSPQCSVGLFRQVGAVDRVMRNLANAHAEPLKDEDYLMVVFEDAPPSVIDALRQWYGLDRLPIPQVVQRGDVVRMHANELAILATVLRLVATVSPSNRTAALSVRNGEEALHVTITTPVPAARKIDS